MKARVAAVLAIAAAVALLLLLGRRRAPETAPRSAAAAAEEPSRASGFAGTVRDLKGRAIGTAVVEALWIGEDSEPRDLPAASGDSRGGYHLDLQLPAGEEGVLILMAKAAGYGTSGRQVDPAERRQDFVLAEGTAQVAVRARDAQGAAVAGAAVMLSIEPEAGERGALAVLRGSTSQAGEAIFAEVPAAAATIHWTVRAAGKGSLFGDQRKEWGTAPVSIDARLRPGALISGTIVDKEGKPVAGASVALAEDSGPWGAHTRAGEAGKFTVPDVPTGVPLALRLDADELVLAEGLDQLPLLIPEGRLQHQLTVRVEPAGSIAGQVVTAKRAAIASAVVDAVPSDGRAGARRHVATGADGRFRLRGLRLDSAWNLEVHHPDHAPAFVDSVRPARGGAPLTVTLLEGGTIAGRVAWDNGAPAPGVEVYVQRVENGGQLVRGLKEFATVRTSPDGTWVIEHVNPGSVRVEVRSKARMAWASIAASVSRATIVEGETAQAGEVVLQRGGSLELMIAGELGDHLANLSFMQAGATGAPHEMAAQRDANGLARVDGLEPGLYDLNVRLDHAGSLSEAGVRIRPGEVSRVQLRFPERIELSGVALRADGTPAAGARIDLFLATSGSQPRYTLPGRAPDNFSGATAIADAAGAFTIAGVDPGGYRVHATVKGEAPLDGQAEVAPESHPFEVRFPPSGTCEVRVADADDQPVSGRIVVLEHRERSRYSTSLVTDAGGTARFDLLPPGTYLARAVGPGQPTAPCESVAGGTTSVSVRLAPAEAAH